jgi:hypothetical protein
MHSDTGTVPSRWRYTHFVRCQIEGMQHEAKLFVVN